MLCWCRLNLSGNSTGPASCSSFCSKARVASDTWLLLLLWPWLLHHAFHAAPTVGQFWPACFGPSPLPFTMSEGQFSKMISDIALKFLYLGIGKHGTLESQACPSCLCNNRDKW
jgi:hypothetical protein